MRNKAYGVLKQVITAITTMAKSKTMAFKSKARAIKTRLVIFSLLQNKRLFMGSVSHKLNALVAHMDNNSVKLEDHDDDGILEDHQQSPSQAIFFYNNNAMCRLPSACETQIEMELPLQQQDKGELEEEEDDGEVEVEGKYPDPTHSLFDSDPGGSVSVIDIVKNSKEDKGEEFKLEDEIDRVADLFIRRFHHQIRMQKQQSLKRHHEMLERSV
ncbi:hypothetical protein PTKIN_Ptkin01aG0254000 [Pterospermum kingtungense]